MADGVTRWRIGFTASQVLAVVPGAGKCLLVIEVNMGRAQDWDTIKSLIAARNDLATRLQAENAALKAQLEAVQAAPATDDDRRVDAEMAELAKAVRDEQAASGRPAEPAAGDGGPVVPIVK